MTAPFGQDADARIRPEAAAAMQAAILEAGGREVFFAGTLDPQGRVETVRVCARGTDEAVPAFITGLGLRDVVIHNHPSGDIAPSDADIRIGALCAHNGHGAYIVDNELERVYVVVEPFLERDVHRLDVKELEAVFGPDSKMARLLPEFEARPQQLEMLDTVAGAFNDGGVAAIEAPTGIGKTFAYLVPTVLWAVRNRERVVVSTRTINLQEQIILKDIPLLQRCLKEPFNAVLVKGRNNYVCLRKYERMVQESLLEDDPESRAVLDRIGQWLERTQDGSKSDLPFMPPRDLWDQICSEADACTGTRCAYSARCYVTRARRELAKAHLIVANHHLLFADIALKWDLQDFNSLGVLPVYKRVILDEAHSIEDSATEYFGIEAARNGAANLFGRFYRKERTHERGLIPFIKMKLVKEVTKPFSLCDQALQAIDNAFLPSIAAARESVFAAFDAIRTVTGEKCGQIGRDIKWRLTESVLADPDLRKVHEVYVLPAVEELVQLLRQCSLVAGALAEFPPRANELECPFLPEIHELNAYKARLERLAAALREAFDPKLAENTVRWIEIDSANASIIRIIRCPIDVGELLAKAVYENLTTVVLTSATLTVQRQFPYFFSRTGLDHVPEARLVRAVLDTPFDYSSQAKLFIVRDLPAPDEPAFLDRAVDTLRELLKITKGHALVLFTSFYALDHAHRRLEKELTAGGIVPLKQGVQSRTQTLDRFRQDISSVLFATDSFWEGIDVAGKALQCVIVPRLPFRVPTEPIQQARAEAIDAAGRNAFLDYMVPQAVIKFRQGFGRLIRRKSDRGTIVVLDRRIAGKYYGRIFLDSLPGVPVVVGTRREVYEGMAQFHGVGPAGPSVK